VWANARSDVSDAGAIAVLLFAVSIHAKNRRPLAGQAPSVAGAVSARSSVAAQLPRRFSASADSGRRHRPDSRHPSASPRVEENTAADSLELSAEQTRRLNDLTPASGERHDEANMSTVNR
jgi:hypothetical protein